MMKERLPRKKKKQSRLVSKWLAAHPEYRRIDPFERSGHKIHVYPQCPKKFFAYVREHKAFFEGCPDVMERVRYELAHAFTEVVAYNLIVEEHTDDVDKRQFKRCFCGTLELIVRNEDVSYQT